MADRLKQILTPTDPARPEMRALLDAGHALHERATLWFGGHVAQGWASCPLTQNGCVRIMSHASYPGALPVQGVITRLAEATGTRHHEFWPDDLSILDAGTFDTSRIHGPRQVTDVYLLALAVAHGGCFVTFHGSVARTSIQGADARHLVAL